MWDSYKKGFKAYLQLEKSLADNSVDAYLRDIDKVTQYLQEVSSLKTPADIELKDLQNFIRWVAELGMTPASQARIISGIKAFYKYCVLEKVTHTDPTALLEAPKLKRSLPDVLSFDEIEDMLAAGFVYKECFGKPADDEIEVWYRMIFLDHKMMFAKSFFGKSRQYQPEFGIG